MERGTSFRRVDDDDDDGRLKRLSYGVVYSESDECTGVYQLVQHEGRPARHRIQSDY